MATNAATALPDNPFYVEKSNPISFADAKVGDSRSLIANGPAQMIQARDYDTGKLATWDDGNPRMVVVIYGTDPETGEKASLWVPKPSDLFVKIGEAIENQGYVIDNGVRVVVTWTGTQAPRNPKHRPSKVYSVELFSTSDQDI